ncbi:MAG TPA: TglA family RiPP precursor [Mycobacteriales bacterium]|nr:TglA family RiPP precursor [Mycobacteriales bacterium]
MNTPRTDAYGEQAEGTPLGPEAGPAHEADDAIEEFDLDDIEVIESKVFG